MTTEVHLECVAIADKPVLANLMQLYRHDGSEFGDDHIDPRGRFSAGAYFDAYWVEPERTPYFIRHAARLAGFALVRGLGPGQWSIAEFFVVRGARRRGIGRCAAFWIFDSQPGQWSVAQEENNRSAQRFWRRVVAEYTGGDFLETTSPAQPRGPRQIFESRTSASG